MKQSVFVGIALAIVILAACFLTPALRGSSRRATEKAREHAELARRELARVDQLLPRLGALADVTKMKEADLAPAAEKSADRVKEISAEYAKLVRQAQELAQRHGLPAPEFLPLTGGAAGAKNALAEFQKAVVEDDKLLSSAISEATAAMATEEGKNTLAVAQVLGMAQYDRAADQLEEAEKLRAQQIAKQVQLLSVAAEWKVARGYTDHFRGLDVGPILAQLRTDLTELAEKRAQADADAKALADQVAQREQELVKVVADEKTAKDQLLSIEEQGFTAGLAPSSPQSFESYRARYLETSARLQKLQEQEQELRYGGRRGAELAGDDAATAEIKNGAPVAGLEEMQRRLATAEEKAKRSASGHLSLDERAKYVTQSGQAAQAEIQRYQTRLTQLDTEQKAILGEIQELAKQALEKEEKALAAAVAAVRAFADSQRAAQAYVSAASELQNARDPDRKNERLTAIVSDPYLKQFGQSAEAAARVLAGRIHAERVDSMKRLIDDIRLFTEIKPDPSFKFDPAPLQTVLDTARSAGLETLERARKIYEEMARTAPKTSGVPLAALAAAWHLTARLDEAEAAKYLADAARYAQQAVEKREQSPYLAGFVKFRDYLSAGGGGKPEKENPEDKSAP